MMKSNAFFSQLFTLHHHLTWLNSITICMIAFLVRSLFFGCYVQYGERYRQADTLDYHGSAYALTHGKGMVNLMTGEPIFWRTPGYPLYLSIFYRLFGVTKFDFSAHAAAQCASIWLQILLCSLIPLLVWILAWIMLNNYPISWLCAWATTMQPGFILANSFLLSDALSLLPLFGGFCLFFSTVRLWKEAAWRTRYLNSYWILAASAICFGIYTWIRPNGQFTIFLLIIMLLASSYTWQEKIKRASFFVLIFFVMIAPWYARNYSLTKRIFYCPMSGPYLQTFLTPKILRRLTNKPLVECINTLLLPPHKQWLAEREIARKEFPPRFVSRELLCADHAWPIIYHYPWWFLTDWIKEVCKTAFDLYSHQLIAFTDGSFIADPVEEFLTIKWQECLYAMPAPWWMRFVCWLEAFWIIFLWIGVVGGLMLFLFSWWRHVPIKADSALWNWLLCGFFFAGTVWMTGGFGYARLRLPAEPFLMVASLNFWYNALLLYYYKRKKRAHCATVATFDNVPTTA